MDIGEQSVEFIRKQMELNFKEMMTNYIVENMYWIETKDGVRAVSTMHEITKKKSDNNNNNLICLFPPFIPKD
jgi:hypothetical protein